jgi:hypothetical protein
MKTRRLQALISAQGSPRICAQSSACIQAPNDTRQFMDFQGKASSISLPNAKELCSCACLNAKKQLAIAWRYASSLLSHAGTKARAWSLCSLSNTSKLISRISIRAQKQTLCAWKRIRAQQIARSHSKRLQVAETVSLGEKRFVAVIKVDGREFLIGGGATNVSLLAQLDPKKQLNAKKSFDGILTEKMTVPKKQPAKRAKKKIAKSPVEKAGG